MLATTNKRERIADKLFYSIITILVIVLGIVGSIITNQRIADIKSRTERRVETTANYLEKVLPLSIVRLNAKEIRNDIEKIASDELQVVEIFDENDDRIYVYERSGKSVDYDKKITRDLNENGKRVGKMVAYFSLSGFMKNLQIKELFRFIVIISVIGLVLGAGLFFLVKKTVIRPIEKTLDFSKELADGNYDKRIDVTQNDEMGLLQNSLNDMADSMQESVENIRASFYEAEGSRQQALEASRLKSEFLASMSHEIRTPINAIIGFADLLLDDEKSEDKRENLKTIKKSANILLENINDILDFSKIEAGKLKLSKTEFSLRDLIEEIGPIVKLRLHGKNVEFKVALDKGAERPILGDRLRLRQVLLNTLINSAKFTHKGEIVLSAERVEGNDEILFKVQDTGIGIPKESQEKIFEPFTQGDGTITREYGGTGLGLAIAKRLVEMMDGRIWLESIPGDGTIVCFTIGINSQTV